jgi:serralysin
VAEKNSEYWCFAWPQPFRASSGKMKAVLAKAARWNPGDVITVGFLDGDQKLRDRVASCAKEWTGASRANIEFAFRKNANTLIRISFTMRGSWSTIGTTCRNVPKDKPTMNFGWLTKKSKEEELRRVVLHEFGHALGLIHEHQHPVKGIQWNRRQVISDLSGEPHNWTRKQIETNMFAKLKKSQTNFTALDPKSIMLYPIPSRWTTNNFSSILNTTLSATDIKFIRTQYPHV